MTKMERPDHYRLKKQICEYLGNNGWLAETEAKMRLFTKHDARKDTTNNTITVDVLAWKDGKLYIAEIGSLQSFQRETYLDFVADVFDHLQLDRKKHRGNRHRKWKGVTRIRFFVPERGPFTNEIWDVTRHVPVC